MAQDNKVVHLTGQKAVGRFSLPSALVRLRDASGRSLKTVLGSFFEQADDSLFALADRAGSNQDQAAYFDAMRELRLRRKAMTVSILQKVSQAFNELGSFRPVSKARSLEDADRDSLSLLDHSDLEQQVAIENLTNRLRNRYQESLSLLAARIRHVVPELALTEDQIPLSPEVLCGGIAEACSDLDIDIRAKLVVLKLFERMLSDQLGDFYQECNRTLIAEGVLPEMKKPPVAGSQPSARKTVPVPGTSVGGFGAGGQSRYSQGGASPTFNELSALLHQGSGSGASVTQPGALVLDTSHLLAKLNELQGASHAQGGEQIIPLREQLQPVLQPQGGGQVSVGQVNSDVINLVSMLFDFILEDRQLHPVMKALIGRLQIPVLKVALSDRNFFNRGGHPVRKLLNELALAAIGWSEKRPGMRDPLREKIEEIVGRVLSEFTERVELFEELLKDFGHFMDLDRRRRELVEQRLRDAEEGRARQERASQAAERLIEEQSSNRDIPEPVLQMLKEPWTRYLQWVALRHGEESEFWESACELTGRLVWSVDPHPVSPETRSELLRAIPDVVEDLRKALQEISWDPFATDAAIRDLELVHVDVFQKLVTAPVEENRAPLDNLDVPPAALDVTEVKAPVASEPQSLAAEPEALAPEVAEPVDTPEESNVDQAPESELAQQWIDKADQLRVGSWLELQRDDTRLRCKLAAFIKATGKYIFVNRSGAKVAEFQRDDLARAMQEGSISLLDDGLIFDRALESIIDNLRHSRKD
ncbi:DUF1631 domain-containing protein [Marinobacter sp. SS5-14b]|uniref:DUF1631 domain-containing protein n=1 Tax=Marinobacter sp. SS5-14b TaxID=3050456 RepID=UPI0026DED967|nr:DUF1631 domain-containing protein [Marinobacter sp. SS5-14b]